MRDGDNARTEPREGWNNRKEADLKRLKARYGFKRLACERAADDEASDDPGAT